MSYKIVVNMECPSQGSMKAFPFKKKNGKLGVNQVHQDSKGIYEYRKAVSEVSKEAHEDFFGNKEDAFAIKMIFYVEKPVSVKRELPTGRYDKDLDKRIRATLDALTFSEVYNKNGIFADDSQVVKVEAVKLFSETGKTIIFIEKVK